MRRREAMSRRGHTIRSADDAVEHLAVCVSHVDVALVVVGGGSSLVVLAICHSPTAELLTTLEASGSSSYA